MNTTLQWALLFSALTESIDRPEDKDLTDHRSMLIDLTDRVVAELTASNTGLAFLLPEAPK